MRRQDGGAGRGACGREGTLLAPPGGSGLRPGVLGRPARSWLTDGGWAGLGNKARHGQGPKARPGP